MPLLFKDTVLNKATIAVWQIKEEEEFFLSRAKHQCDTAELDRLKGNRRLEWIASRFLIQEITPGDFFINKDRYGKPQLSPPDYNISISHSHGYVAAIYAKEEVGIDIQKKVNRIDRIAHKFINDSEQDFINNRSYISNLHVIWGAKESLFKAYGRKEVDFRKHLNVEAFRYRKKGFFQAEFLKEDHQFRYQCANLYFKNFHLVFCQKS
jgi:phosphopantetheinyl transferase